MQQHDAATGNAGPGSTEDFAPCPMCRQYSHSIGHDALAAAFMHFQSMIAHPVRGHPMGDAFDEKTRDAAQVLMTAARLTAQPAEGELRAPLERICGTIEESGEARDRMMRMARIARTALDRAHSGGEG